MSFDAAHFAAQCAVRHSVLGSPLVYRACTGSTNDDALLAARSGAPHGALFLADEQTAGRGRRGHTWFAAPGESLLFSVLLRPEIELSQVSAFTLAVGLALRDALRPRFSPSPRIKWPNDLLVDKKKLAGVLVESQLQGQHLNALVVGVGLNVATREFPTEIAERATSLALLRAESVARETLLLDLLAAIATRLHAYTRSGVAGIACELNEADALCGLRLRVDGKVGVGRGLDERGCLLLEDDDHAVHAISSGTVELL